MYRNLYTYRKFLVNPITRIYFKINRRKVSEQIKFDVKIPEFFMNLHIDTAKKKMENTFYTVRVIFEKIYKKNFAMVVCIFFSFV